MKVRLESGAEAEARACDGNTLTLRSPQAFAPGSPIRFCVVVDEEERNLEGRTIGSRRIDDGRYEVRLRFVNLRRGDRDCLLRALQ